MGARLLLLGFGQPAVDEKLAWGAFTSILLMFACACTCRWTPDPWAAVASQVTAGAGPSGSGPSSSRGYGDGSGSGSLIVGGEHELPASSQQQHLYAMASATHAICVAPHPDRDYFISGA